MWIPELIVLGVVVGTNNLAVALALGALGQVTQRGRIVAVFGVFEFVAPLLGLWLGQAAARWIEGYAAWLGPALLIGLGAWVLATAFRRTLDEEKLARRVTHCSGLVVLAAALSVDNLIVGFSLGLFGASPLLVASVIAGFSVVFTWAGVTLGHRSRRHWQRATALGSGGLLIALGVATAMGWL